MIALGGLRQLAVGWRLHFETPIAGQMARTRVIVTDGRHGIDVAAAIDRGHHMHALGKAPIALDDRIRCVDAVDDDGDARADQCAKVVSWSAMPRIVVVTPPTAPCRPMLAQVSQRAETGRATAITFV